MTPIHKLLSRILWDREFGQGDFVLGYQDRFSPKVIHVRLPVSAGQVQEAGGGSALRIVNQEGEEIALPYHRIVEVRRDGQVIWQRGAAKLGGDGV